MAEPGQSENQEGQRSMAVEQASFETADNPPGSFGDAVDDSDSSELEPACGELQHACGDAGPAGLSDRQRLERTETLLEEHHEAVFRYAYRLTSCSATAEDITQEVFLRAFRHLHQLREDAAARGWLMVIARNEFARWCRKSASSGVDLDPQLCESLGELEEPAIDRNEWVKIALDELPSEFRAVLLMFYFEDLSYAEIAEQLQIPIGTVMSRLSRGRSHMKKALESQEL